MLTSSEQNTDISLAKNIKDSIATPLTHIFKQSLLTCVFPNQLKMAKGHSHLKKEKKKTSWCFFCFCVDFHCVFFFHTLQRFRRTQNTCGRKCVSLDRPYPLKIWKFRQLRIVNRILFFFYFILRWWLACICSISFLIHQVSSHFKWRR